jgi:thiamine pyrophosphate-dependent acetolactate synthase large subunit-like protein
MVGGRFNWMFQQGRGLSEHVRIAQIDVEAEEMWSHVDIEVGLVADAAIAVEQINQALEGRKLRSADNGWVASLRESAMKNSSSLEEEMLSDQQPINHHRLVADVRDAVSRDAIVVEEGEVTMGIMRQLMPSFLPRHRLGAGTTGCMGTGFPYAVGAKLAQPNADVVAVLGDYAFGAAAMEVETCARLGINVVIVISNNAGISAHTMQARFPADAPPVGAMIPADYEKMAEMVGGYAERVTDPNEIKPAIQRGLASHRVSLINVITDPDAGKGRRTPRTMYI